MSRYHAKRYARLKAPGPCGTGYGTGRALR
jgi:hypothetical protein